MSKIKSGLLTVIFTGILSVPAYAEISGGSSFDLNNANAIFEGSNVSDSSGERVAAAGDVNGDKIEDLIIGARFADHSGADAGAAYVVFGSSELGSLNLASLSGKGFRIEGANPGDLAGISVAGIGDVNGDGLADLAVGAAQADNNGKNNSGSVYVVFGRATTTTLSLNNLGTGGYRIDGATSGDQLGFSLSPAGDQNGDGRADLLAGAYLAGAAQGKAEAGSVYMLYGKSTNANINLATLGASGVRFDGANAGDHFGFSVALVGKVNGDQVPDFAVGAPDADPQGRISAGAAYMIYGGNTGPVVSVSGLGANGYLVEGAQAGDRAGYAVAGGEYNHDSAADLLVGSPRAQGLKGTVSVVYGASTGADLNNLGSRGFVITGGEAGDKAGMSIANGADLNGDGYQEIFFGATGSTHISTRDDAGSAYVIFGKQAHNSVDLSAFGTGGFILEGPEAFCQVGTGASTADVNGDGNPDMMIGGSFCSDTAGETFIIYGWEPPVVQPPVTPEQPKQPEVKPEPPKQPEQPKEPETKLPPAPKQPKLTSASGCVKNRFFATVTGGNIKNVVFKIDGKKVKATKVKKDKFRISVNPQKFKVGVHKVTAKVTFTDGRAPVTLKSAFQRCKKLVPRPKVTG